jgi:hypothetical protein
LISFFIPSRGAKAPLFHAPWTHLFGAQCHADLEPNAMLLDTSAGHRRRESFAIFLPSLGWADSGAPALKKILANVLLRTFFSPKLALGCEHRPVNYL